MGDIFFEVFLIAILILINGIFSMTEIAVVSSRKVRLMRSAADGSAGAAKALELQESPDRFLSTVQIGITLVGILSGAFGGAMLADEFAGFALRVPVLAPYADTIGFGVVIAVITFFSLVVGELVPKNIALNRPETIATFFSRPMDLISKITSPFVWLLSSSTKGILKILRIKEGSEAAITEEEIRAHIAHGTQLGVLDQTEHELIEGVIRLDDEKIAALMTPRLKIDWIDLESGIDRNKQTLIDSKYSRLPVCRGGLDDVIGIVKARELLSHLLSTGDLEIESLIRKPIFVPETVTSLELLQQFKESPVHIALVVDEFGSIEGLITMNDILEEIVGDFPTATLGERDVVYRDDGSMLLNGNLPINEVARLLNLTHDLLKDGNSFQALGGFILAELDRVPNEGDRFEREGYVFEVIDMDGRRVDKVLAVKTNNPDDEN